MTGFLICSISSGAHDFDDTIQMRETCQKLGMSDPREWGCAGKLTSCVQIPPILPNTSEKVPPLGIHTIFVVNLVTPMHLTVVFESKILIHICQVIHFQGHGMLDSCRNSGRNFNIIIFSWNCLFGGLFGVNGMVYNIFLELNKQENPI